MGFQIVSIKSIYTFLAREKASKKSRNEVLTKLCESSKPNPLLMKLIQNYDARFWLVIIIIKFSTGSLFDFTQILQTNIDFISKTYILLPFFCLDLKLDSSVFFFVYKKTHFKDIDFQQVLSLPTHGHDFWIVLHGST